MEKTSKGYKEWIFPLIIVTSSTLLFFASTYSFLLFHVLVELFTVLIALSIFVIAWSSRKYIDNIFLLVIGAGYFFVGSIDLLHMLSYGGMGMIAGHGINLPTQLWIAARYLEVISFIGAFILLNIDASKEIKASIGKFYGILFLYAAVFSAVVISIFYLKIFPDAYVDGQGLTPFKIYSEYIISFLLFIALIILFLKRKNFDREMINLLSMALIMKIFSELLFTKYIGVYDFSNVLGHVFRFISFLLLYKAFFEVGLDRPYKLLFSNLKKSEERYKSLVEFSPDLIVVHRKGRVLYANRLAKDFFGIREDKDVVGAEVVNFFHPRYRAQIMHRMKKIFSGEWKEAPRTEMEAINHEGKVVPVEVKGMTIVFEGKKAVESIIRDISERREAEKKIRSLAQFPEENPNPVIRATADGQVKYANKPAREMLASLDWKEKDLLPEPLFSSVRIALEKKERPNLELECKYGRIYFIEFAPSLTDGHINMYGRDITDRKLAEKKLAEVQAELQRKMEHRLIESYQHVGMINRRISLILELEDNFRNKKKSKQEMIDHMLVLIRNLSQAKVGLFYAVSGTNHFSLISSLGLDKAKIGKVQMLAGNSFDFLVRMIEEKKRINNPCKLDRSGCFKGLLEIKYFIAMPIFKNGACAGFIFLGFVDRESMDSQELEFLDVFMKHVSSALAEFKILN